MKAHYHPNVMCPGCRTVMRYENEALYCAHPTCEFFERKYQAPAIELLPYAPADVPTTGGTRLTLSAAQLTLLQHLAAGARTYELLAVKLGKSYGATVVLLNDIKRKCGFGYKQQDALLKLALAQGWVSEIKPAQAVTKTGLPPGYKQTFTQKRPAELAVKPTEEETGNTSWTPSSPDAVKLGRALSEPFSLMDLTARLDADRNGLRPQARAGRWLADWLSRRWIESASFGQYRRTEKFGR